MELFNLKKGALLVFLSVGFGSRIVAIEKSPVKKFLNKFCPTIIRNGITYLKLQNLNNEFYDKSKPYSIKYFVLKLADLIEEDPIFFKRIVKSSSNKEKVLEDIVKSLRLIHKNVSGYNQYHRILKEAFVYFNLKIHQRHISSEAKKALSGSSTGANNSANFSEIFKYRVSLA